MYGPVRTVVWQGSAGNRRPYADLKLTPDGLEVVFATYFGGVGFDHIDVVKVGSDGQIHLAGGTQSPDFPADRRIGAGATLSRDNAEIFYVCMTEDGSRLIFSTLTGGSRPDWLMGMDLDASSRAVLAGWTASRDFPTVNALQPASADVIDPLRETREGFVLRLSRDARELEFSTYWGGSRFDSLSAVAARQDGVLVVAGETHSSDFPLCESNPPRRDSDIVVSAIDPSQSRALWSRCFGGSGHEAASEIATVPGGTEFHLVGYTASADFLPSSQRVFGCGRDRADTGYDAFLATFDDNGSLLKSMRIGGDRDDRAWTVRALPNTGVLLAGATLSAIFPTGPRGFLGPRTSEDSAWVMEIADTPPRLLLNDVVSSTSFSTGPVSPGEVVSLFGFPIGPACPATFEPGDERIADELHGVRVLFDGRPAPILFAGKRQVNVVAPFEIAGSTRVELEVDGVLSNAIVRRVAATNPAIYALDGSGAAAAINQDGSINGIDKPAARGSIVALFLTGGGTLEPRGRNGAIASVSPLARLAAPVRVNIGGVEAEVIFAGAAPGLVFGVTQVNVRVPAATPTGAVPVRIRIGGSDSDADRYLMIR